MKFHQGTNARHQKNNMSEQSQIFIAKSTVKATLAKAK